MKSESQIIRHAVAAADASGGDISRFLEQLAIGVRVWRQTNGFESSDSIDTWCHGYIAGMFDEFMYWSGENALMEALEPDRPDLHSP